jgi:hypothetical protein
MLAAAMASKIMTLVKAVQMLASGQKLATVAQWAFNAAAGANPVGLIVTAIGILIGLFILAYKKCEPFRNAVNGILEKLKALGAHIVQVLSPAFEKIKSVFEKVGAVIGAIVGTVGRLISIFFNLFNITGQVSGAFGFLDAVLNIISGTIQFVLTLLGGVVDTIGAIFTGINDVIDAFSNGGFLAGIKQIGLSILNYMLTPIKAVLDALSIIPGIGGLAKGASEKIGSFQESLRYNKDDPAEGKNAPAQAAAVPVNRAAPPAALASSPVTMTASAPPGPRLAQVKRHRRECASQPCLTFPGQCPSKLHEPPPPLYRPLWPHKWPQRPPPPLPGQSPRMCPRRLPWRPLDRLWSRLRSRLNTISPP